MTLFSWSNRVVYALDYCLMKCVKCLDYGLYTSRFGSIYPTVKNEFSDLTTMRLSFELFYLITLQKKSLVVDGILW